MAVIDLNLSSDYCPTWKTWEGIRELVQNAVDGQDSGYPMRIEYSPRTSKLTITNEGVQLPEEALVLGYSFKGGSRPRGKHGEGLKVGLLALVRAGHEVTIYNGLESWRPSLEQRGSLKVLKVTTRALKNERTDLSIEVEGIPEEWWAKTRRLFLFLSPPAAKDILQVDENQVLLHPDYAGHVFCRGIFVTQVRDMRFGYEVPDLELDRDRGMIRSWDFRYRMAALWEEACRIHPSRAAPMLYDAMTAAGTTEELRAADTCSGSMRITGRELKAEMRRRRGDRAVAVANIGQAQGLRSAGLEPVTLPQALVSLMELDGETAESLRNSQRERVSAMVDLCTLTSDEEGMLTALGRIVDLDKLAVVHFVDPEVRARNEKNEQVLVDRSLLAQPIRRAAALCVAAEAARSGKPMTDILLEALYRDEGPGVSGHRSDGSGRVSSPGLCGGGAEFPAGRLSHGQDVREAPGGSGGSTSPGEGEAGGGCGDPSSPDGHAPDAG
jgi:hypothetical protein